METSMGQTMDQNSEAIHVEQDDLTCKYLIFKPGCDVMWCDICDGSDTGKGVHALWHWYMDAYWSSTE